jgi:ABC-type multidrug transport system fused ATPase/permease subunit
MITFVVAHRLSTIEKADTILLLDKGEIIGRGSYAYLYENSSSFQELANKTKED